MILFELQWVYMVQKVSMVWLLVSPTPVAVDPLKQHIQYHQPWQAMRELQFGYKAQPVGILLTIGFGITPQPLPPQPQFRDIVVSQHFQ